MVRGARTRTQQVVASRCEPDKHSCFGTVQPIHEHHRTNQRAIRRRRTHPPLLHTHSPPEQRNPSLPFPPAGCVALLHNSLILLPLRQPVQVVVHRTFSTCSASSLNQESSTRSLLPLSPTPSSTSTSSTSNPFSRAFNRLIVRSRGEIATVGTILSVALIVHNQNHPRSAAVTGSGTLDTCSFRTHDLLLIADLGRLSKGHARFTDVCRLDCEYCLAPTQQNFHRPIGSRLSDGRW